MNRRKYRAWSNQPALFERPPIEVATELLITQDQQEGRDEDSPGYVYFIETADGRYIKIGFSIHPARRLCELGTLRPSEFMLNLLGVAPGSIRVERLLHEYFREYRDNGEWFSSSPELREFIEQAKRINKIIVPAPRIVPQEVAKKAVPDPRIQSQQERSPAAVALGRLGGKARGVALRAGTTPITGAATPVPTKCPRCGLMLSTASEARQHCRKKRKENK